MIYCQKMERLKSIWAVSLLKVGRPGPRPTEIGSDHCLLCHWFRRLWQR